MFVLCMAMSLLLSVTSVSADDSVSEAVTGYGTLSGYINQLPFISTSVTKNNDNAYLTYELEIQDILGNRLKVGEDNSRRGAKLITADLGYAGEKAKNIYGSHGVRGGRTYGAAAIYTYTKADY